MSDTHIYTIGWLCVLPSECRAALTVLDEEHEPPTVGPNDENNYILGRLGKHNIVIVVLPIGRNGAANAAAAANSMCTTFPNIRFCLMVGVGGGAPKKHNIRLGDVVVSVPNNHNGTNYGGVVHYDYGKTIQSGRFQSVEYLAPPPKSLLAAITQLRARHEGSASDINEKINSIIAKNVRLREKYSRPPTTSETPNLDNKSMVQIGATPASLQDEPSIHYGLIASAHTFMEDSHIRDMLSEDIDVLCFEMEAAGLMNNVPCLVIRGICDYADRSWSTEWRGYASMTAAVYAKDLLQRVVVQQVHHEMRMRDIVLGIQEEMTYVARHQRDADYEQLLDWLSHTDYAPKQNEILREKQRGTCLWLFDTREFQHWEKTPGQVLHGFGIPGAGKTFAASSVINFLQQKYLSHSGIGIAYVYCDFRRQQEQKADNILANILKQLLHSRPDLAHVVKVFHQRHYKARSKPILSEVATMLHTVVQSFERVFIVIDALDELNGSQYELLRELVPLQETYSANILMTARKDVFYVEKWFKKVESLEIAAVERDIRSYLDSNACRIPAHILSTSGLAEEVKSTIITAAKGMFLLARLAFEDLISKGSVKDVKAALKNLPSGSSAYNEAYRIAIRRISQHHRHLAKRIFTWLTLAKRPINVLELQHALAIQTGENPLDPETWQNSSDFPNICCGLITIERETNIIRLVHFTVQHYFENTLIPERQVLEYGVAIACVRYLSLDTFAAGRCASDCQGLVEFRDRLSKYKFYDYAAKNWGYHLQEARSACQEVFSLLLSFPKCDASSQSLLLEHNVDDERHDRCDWDGSRRVNGLHLAAYFGLDSIVGYLLPQFDINTPCEIGRTALSYAALNGYAGVVQLLLDRGAEIDFRDMRGQTPLSLAAENGREQVVNLLIRRGANIDSISDDVCADYQTPLSYAAARGDERMVNLLLHYNANVDLQSLQEATALILAAENGYDGIVRLLLQQNADIDLQDYRDKTALARAASNGHESIVQLLLSYGADVDFLDDEGKSALDLAASNGHIDVVKLFFHHEDDICQQDIVTLAYAVRNRREEVVKFLIKHIIGI